MKVYVVGNPLVKEDSLPVRILPLLRKNLPKIDFVEFDPTENLPEESELTLIDTVINAKEVMVIEDIDKFVDNKALSLHDFDLGLSLKIAKKIGLVKKVKIIGLPPDISESDAVDKIITFLK